MLETYYLTLHHKPFRCSCCACPESGLIAYSRAELGTAFDDYAQYAASFVAGKIESNLHERTEAVDLNVIKYEAQPQDEYTFDRLLASIKSANHQLYETRTNDETWGPEGVFAWVAVIAVWVKSNVASVAYVGKGVSGAVVRDTNTIDLINESAATHFAEPWSLGQADEIEIAVGEVILLPGDYILLGKTDYRPNLYNRALAVLSSSPSTGDSLVRIFAELQKDSWSSGPLVLARYGNESA